MEGESIISGPVATVTPVYIGYDLLTPLLRFLFGETGLISFISVAGIIHFFAVLWTTYAILAYCVALVFLYFYIYATLQLKNLSAIESERIKAHESVFQKRSEVLSQAKRFAVMADRVASENPDDWRLAIIEADIILDQVLKKRGFAGVSLGERLRSISPSALQSLDDAWQAHKIRNYIAHGGDDFILTKKLAQDTIVRYRRVFEELGVE